MHSLTRISLILKAGVAKKPSFRINERSLVISLGAILKNTDFDCPLVLSLHQRDEKHCSYFTL